MNRQELATEIARCTGPSEREARIVIDAIAETSVRTASSGASVNLMGFGAFYADCLRQTGGVVRIRRFRHAGAIRHAMNAFASGGASGRANAGVRTPNPEGADDDYA
jgi:hypothetical protein